MTIQRPRLRCAEEFERKGLALFQRRAKERGALLPELNLHVCAKGGFDLALRGSPGDGPLLPVSSSDRLKAKGQLAYAKGTPRTCHREK